MSDHHTKVSGGGGEAAVGGCNIGGAEKSVVSNTSGAETIKDPVEPEKASITFTSLLNAAIPAFVPKSPPLSYSEALKSQPFTNKAVASGNTSGCPEPAEPHQVELRSENLVITTNNNTANQTASAINTTYQAVSTPVDTANQAIPTIVDTANQAVPTEQDTASGVISEDASTRVSPTIDKNSAITTVVRSAPPVRSFLGLNSQTQDIPRKCSRPALDLISVGLDSAPVPTRTSFQATWALNRTRSSAFPTSRLNLESTTTTLTASAAAFSSNTLTLSASVAVLPTSTDSPSVPSVIRASARLSPVHRTPLSTPRRGSLNRHDLSAKAVAHHRLHRPTQSFSQFERSGGYRCQPVNRRLSFTPAKTSLHTSQSLTEGSVLETPVETSRSLIAKAAFETPVKTSQRPSDCSLLDRPDDTPVQAEMIRRIMENFKSISSSSQSAVRTDQEEQISSSESLEPLTVPSQPVTSYTTVGSLRPTTTQHFNAPNRIQRDGIGRRAAQASLQSRGHESHFGGRNVNQQYGLGYGSAANSQHGGANYSQGFTGQSLYDHPIISPYGALLQRDTSTAQSQYNPVSRFDLRIPGLSQNGSAALPQTGSVGLPQAGVAAQYQPGPLAHYQTGTVIQPQYGVTHQSGYDNLPDLLPGANNRYDYRPTTQYEQGDQHNHGVPAHSDFRSFQNIQSRNGQASIHLADDEKKIIEANGLSESMVGSSMPSTRRWNFTAQHRETTRGVDSVFSSQAEQLTTQDQAQENESGQYDPTGNQTPVIESAGARAHQVTSLHPIARYNPSESSFANTHRDTMSSATFISHQSVITGNTTYSRPMNSSSNCGNTGYGSSGSGGLDRDYRFPPPAFTQNSQPNTPGASYSQQIVPEFGSNNLVNPNQTNFSGVGLPQPLTAGPPGQRQNMSASPGFLAPHGPLSGFTTIPNRDQSPVLPFNSPWQCSDPNIRWSSVQSNHNNIHDTLPPEELRKYYPSGFPSDMTGKYTRRPEEANENRPIMSQEERTNAWFRSGLRHIDMTANDHIAEMERRNRHLESGPGAQPQEDLDEYGNPRTLRGFVEASEPLYIEDINRMEITDVSARLAQPVFGNLLQLADQRPNPRNRAMLSRYAAAQPWAIDDSAQGNQSFFGEDVGPTPRRVGRDPRYQPFE